MRPAPDWEALVRGVGVQLEALELQVVGPEGFVCIAGPVPPPLPSRVRGGRASTRTPGPAAVPAVLPVLASRLVPAAPHERARPREHLQLRGIWRRQWSVPLQGELAERQAAHVGAPRAQLSEPLRGFVDYTGRQTTLPADLETVADPGLRRAVLLEQRRLDNAPDSSPPHVRPVPPGEATARLKRRRGEPTLVDFWRDVDALRAAAASEHERKLAARREERAFRDWARGRGWRVSKSRAEVPEWTASPQSEEARELADAHSLTRTKALRGASLEQLRGQLEALVGPRPVRPPSPPQARAPRRPAPSAPGQLSLFPEGA